MENLDVMVLRTLRDWRRAGKRALLATVVRTWGSSPRPVGRSWPCAKTARWWARCPAAASRTT
jgi:xanthine/CO dehydrogenase XdhC/CoxF family maturation factor